MDGDHHPTLPNLHDSVLEGIEVDWGAATATVRLGLVGDPPPDVALVLSGLREVHVQRNEPWGPSEFVESAEYLDEAAHGELVLRLEMQSGDEITLRAESLEIAWRQAS